MQTQQESAGSSPTVFKRQRRLGGLTWILIVIGVLFVLGFIVSALRKQQAPTRPRAAAINHAPIGITEFINVKEGGVSFNDVYPPDSPADKAGLVGGDIITTFDGRAVRDGKDMTALLDQTPVGKKVEVVYLRDGETRKTGLTTITSEQFEELQEIYENRRDGHGQLGFDDGNTAVVAISGTRISGVQLNDLSSSGPAALAGIKEGDIIIEFDGVPIRKRGELVSRVRRAIPYSTIKVIVMRGGERLEIPVKMGMRG